MPMRSCEGCRIREGQSPQALTFTSFPSCSHCVNHSCPIFLFTNARLTTSSRCTMHQQHISCCKLCKSGRKSIQNSLELLRVPLGPTPIIQVYKLHMNSLVYSKHQNNTKNQESHIKNLKISNFITSNFNFSQQAPKWPGITRTQQVKIIIRSNQNRPNNDPWSFINNIDRS